MKLILSLAIFFFLVTNCIAQTNFVNKDNFSKIEMGMTLEKVEEVLGAPGQLDTTTIYIWPEKNLQAEWNGDKLTSYQTLHPNIKKGEVNGYEVLKEACKGDQGPMTHNQTYNDVVKLLGKEGQLPDWKRYIWWVTKYKKIKVSFRDGKAFESSMF